MILLEQSQLNEIVEQQLIGMVCNVHRQTGQFLTFPDPDRFADFEDQEWAAEMEVVASHPDAYWKVTKMSSQDECQLMETFVNSETRDPWRSQLQLILSQARPFRHFKEAIDRSGIYRQAWYRFRERGWLSWLARQLSGAD